MLIEGPLAEVLRENRERFNALFAQARRQHPRLEADPFATHLREVVAPLAEAARGHDPNALGRVVETLYRLSLELVGRELLGPQARDPLLNLGWEELLPRLPRLLCTHPRGLVATVTNALHNLGRESGARPEGWLITMRRVGPMAADLEEFRRLGVVAAWRAGLAQYRRTALEIAAGIDPALLPGLFEAGEMDRDTLLAALTSDPWGGIDGVPGRRQLRLVALVGGFRGLGGPFIEPPLVGSHGEQLIAWDREGAWEVHADRWGGVLVRARGLDPATLTPSRSLPLVDGRGRMRYRGEEAQFPLAGHSSAVAAGGTLAVTLPDSHQLFLFAVADRGLDG